MTRDQLHTEILAIQKKVASVLEEYRVLHAENILLKSEIEKLKVDFQSSLTKQQNENHLVDDGTEDFTSGAKSNDVKATPTISLDKKQWEEKLTAAIDDIDQCLQMIQSRN